MHLIARFCRNHPRVVRPILRALLPSAIAICELTVGRIPELLVELSSNIGQRLYRMRKLGNGMDMIVPLNDLPGAAIARDGYYELSTVRLIAAILKPEMIFFDVGAHCGQYTLLASPLVGDSGWVHSFEPDPVTYSQLAHNIELNHLGNVIANRAAICDSDSDLTFYESSPEYAGTSSLQPSPYFGGKSYSVKAITLQSYMKERGIPRIDVMKADIEGAEYRMLTGSDDVFSGVNRPIIVMEFNNEAQGRLGKTIGNIHAFLVAHGYDIYRTADLLPYVSRQDDPTYFNVLAWPTERPTEFRT